MAVQPGGAVMIPADTLISTPVNGDDGPLVRNLFEEAQLRVERKRVKAREYMAGGDVHGLAVIKASIDVHAEDCETFRQPDIFSVSFNDRNTLIRQYVTRYEESSKRLTYNLNRLAAYMESQS